MTEKPPVEKAVPILRNKYGNLQWKRKMIAYLSLDDIEIITLKETVQPIHDEKESFTNASAIADYRKRDVIAKSDILLSLGSTPAEPTSRRIPKIQSCELIWAQIPYRTRG